MNAISVVLIFFLNNFLIHSSQFLCSFIRWFDNHTFREWWRWIQLPNNPLLAASYLEFHRTIGSCYFPTLQICVSIDGRWEQKQNHTTHEKSLVNRKNHIVGIDLQMIYGILTMDTPHCSVVVGNWIAAANDDENRKFY